jgi:lysosomal Pro-X carboxypeptidase
LGVVVISTLFLSFTEARKSPFRSFRSPVSVSQVELSDSETPYETYYYNQTLDHFNFATSPQYYKERYLISTAYWDGTGPIFFYSGNEGDITGFWNNSGFITTTLASQFNALLIFAEHRYYGESLPFGEDSYLPSKLGYLTVEQALADYAEIIYYLKGVYNAQDNAVITFGGSYGGMLSAWFRMKYPTVVDGAIAASAPILQFMGTGVSQWDFYEIVTNDYAEVNSLCPEYILDGFNLIYQMGSTFDGRTNLTKIFNLCTPLVASTVPDLVEWLNSAYTYMAMTDYPYPCDFLQPMPGWPVTVSCNNQVAAVQATGDLLQGMLAGVAVYYNYSGQAGSCYKLDDETGSLGGAIPWDYQSCTEMVLPISSNGTSDMFPPSYYNLTEMTAYCQSAFGVTPRPYWMTTTYGGLLTPEGTNNIQGSNIVFSNGMLDPWSGGGVLQTIKGEQDMIAVYMSDSAHHLDLRLPNSADPQSVQQGRQTEISYIQDWVVAKAKKVELAKMQKQ